MKSYIFRVVVEEDAFEDGRRGYHAYCPALKGCHTWGHTAAEALSNIREAVNLYLDDLLESGEPVPRGHRMGCSYRFGECDMMSFLRGITARKLIRALRQDGFELKRTSGSHHLF